MIFEGVSIECKARAMRVSLLRARSQRFLQHLDTSVLLTLDGLLILSRPGVSYEASGHGRGFDLRRTVDGTDG